MPLWRFWRSGLARNAATQHLQQILPTRRRFQLEAGGCGSRGNAPAGPWIGVQHNLYCIARIRAARRLLCRAALLRWMICLFTRLSITGTASLYVATATSFLPPEMA